MSIVVVRTSLLPSTTVTVITQFTLILVVPDDFVIRFPVDLDLNVPEQFQLFHFILYYIKLGKNAHSIFTRNIISIDLPVWFMLASLAYCIPPASVSSHESYLLT